MHLFCQVTLMMTNLAIEANLIHLNEKKVLEILVTNNPIRKMIINIQIDNKAS